MIVNAQPQNPEVETQQDYRLYVNKLCALLDQLLQITNMKLSIFSKIGFRTQHSCFYVKNGVLALVIAPLQGVKI